ncbi:MAG: hypothetical protein QM660_10975 [Dysgonomonas sp.]
MKANELTTVELYNEDVKNTFRFIVTKQDYKVLQQLEYCGGYKRFELTMSEREKQGERQINELLDFLHGIFANKQLINSYFI